MKRSSYLAHHGLQLVHHLDIELAPHVLHPAIEVAPHVLNLVVDIMKSELHVVADVIFSRTFAIKVNGRDDQTVFLMEV